MSPSPSIVPGADLLLREHAWLRGLVASLVRDPADADDVAQDVSVVALTQPPAHAGSLRGWLTAVARSVTRRRALRTQVGEAREHAAARPEAAPSAHDVVARAEAHRAVVDAVLALEEPYRTAVLLRFFEGRKPAEIALQLGCPVATVRTRLVRGLDQLRGRLEQRFGSREGLAAAFGIGSAPAGIAVAAGATATGAMVMGVQGKVLAGVGVVLAVCAVWLWWPKAMEASREDVAAPGDGALHAAHVPAPVPSLRAPRPFGVDQATTGATSARAPEPAVAVPPVQRQDSAAQKPAADPPSASVAGAHAEMLVVRIDGSSTVFPVAEAVAEEFQKAKKGAVKVTVGIAGTGAGFKKFARGEIDVANASRPISKEEMKACKDAGIEYIELPICFDALTVAVNPKNDWVTSMTVEELKSVWEPAAQGKVTRWNQIRPEWPNEKIVLFGAGSDSGTFDYFTEAICGKAKASRGDFTASEDDNVLVQGIEGNKYALGYIPFAHDLRESKLKAVAIEWSKNKVEGPVRPTLANVLRGAYNPLSRPLFMYVSAKAAERAEVHDYVEFVLEKGHRLLNELRYVPLTSAVYAMGRERLAKRTAGTAFGGKVEVGVSTDDLLRRTPSTTTTAGRGGEHDGR